LSIGLGFICFEDGNEKIEGSEEMEIVFGLTVVVVWERRHVDCCVEGREGDVDFFWRLSDQKHFTPPKHPTSSAIT